MGIQNVLQSPKASINWKYVLVAAGLAVLAGVGILACQYWWLPRQETEAPVVVLPQKQDQTADWLTYRNEEYGFEVKYPKELIISPAGWCVEPDCIRFVSENLPEGCEPDCYFDSFSIQAEERGETTYLDWVSGRAEGQGREDFPYTLNKVGEVIIAGVATEIFDDPMTIGVGHSWVSFLVVNDNIVYKFMGFSASESGDLLDKEGFGQILATFKFID